MYTLPLADGGARLQSLFEATFHPTMRHVPNLLVSIEATHQQYSHLFSNLSITYNSQRRTVAMTVGSVLVTGYELVRSGCSAFVDVTAAALATSVHLQHLPCLRPTTKS